MATVELAKINKYYSTLHALKDVTLSVADGAFVVFVGPSGCGKSTLLRTIAGLESVSDGTIKIDGKDVTDLEPADRDLSMVFQSYALYPHMSVRANMEFGMKVGGIPPSERNTRIEEAARILQLSELLDRKPGQLSGGQRQRVALARAIIRRPSVFLMDEPLSNLDAKLRGNMRAELKHMQNTLGITTIYVTHDQIEAMTLAHRVAIMKDGILQQLGTPKEVYADPNNLFVAGFMGSPPMNFVEGQIMVAMFEAHYVKLKAPGLSDKDRVTLGVRPEDCNVVPSGKGQMDADVFTLEMTGDQSLVTFRTGEGNVVVKMPKDFEIEAGARAGIAFDAATACFFDGETGDRLRPSS